MQGRIVAHPVEERHHECHFKSLPSSAVKYRVGDLAMYLWDLCISHVQLVKVGFTFVLFETNVLFDQLTRHCEVLPSLALEKNDVLVNGRNCFAAEISPRDERSVCL